MATAMTPFQAVLRRVVKHAKGRHLPDTSVYCVAEFQKKHPIGESHFDDTIRAVGAHWARVMRRHKKKDKIRVEFIFRMSPAEFASALAEARALKTEGLSPKVLDVALRAAKDAFRKSRMSSSSSAREQRPQPRTQRAS